MSNIKASASANGIGFFGLLTVAFIVLKILNIITWSWVWVLSPLWIPIVIVALIIVGFVTVFVVAQLKRGNKK